MKYLSTLLFSLAAVTAVGGVTCNAQAQANLHSQPAAAHILYLDFDGYRNSTYEQGTTCQGHASQTLNIDIPAFDLNTDPSSFDAAENAFIRDVWERISEDFSPFDVDVTTVRPSAEWLRPGRGIRVVVGGAPDHLNHIGAGNDRRGIASLRENTALVVARFNGPRTARSIAQTASHEAGHLFAAWTGLTHIGMNMSHYGRAHNVTQSERTQILGLHTDDFPTVKRDIWWAHDPVLLGQRIFDTACNRLPVPRDIVGPQEDVAILMAALHLRKDDHGGDARPPAGQPHVAPIPQPQNGSPLIKRGSDFVIAPTGEGQEGRGVIRMNAVSFPRYCLPWSDASMCHRLGIRNAVANDEAFLATIDDLDFFRFYVAGSTQIQARALTMNNGNATDTRANLHLDLELWRKSSGSWVQLRSEANVPFSSLGAMISHSVPPEETGEYAVAVKSKGEYGDLGQYTLRVSGSNLEPAK